VKIFALQEQSKTVKGKKEKSRKRGRNENKN
jgi:hypothetical protein